MSRLHDIHRLALGNAFLDIDEDDLAREVLLCEHIRDRCTDITCTNNCYLHNINSLLMN